MVMYIEPECRDFWLLPGETFELCAEVASEGDDFEIESHEHGVTVWPSVNMGDVSVLASGKELECGHQQPLNWKLILNIPLA